MSPGRYSPVRRPGTDPDRPLGVVHRERGVRRTPPCSRPSPAGRPCRCPASPCRGEARKLSPPEARNEFTVTEYAVAAPICSPSSHIPVIRSPSGGPGRRCTRSPRTRRAAGTAGSGWCPRVALPLLLQHQLDLGAGELHVDERVGERLHVGGLLERQRPRVRPAAVPTMSARRPPGFMNAICGRPVSGRPSPTAAPRRRGCPASTRHRGSRWPLASLARLNGATDSPSSGAPSTSAFGDGGVDDGRHGRVGRVVGVCVLERAGSLRRGPRRHRSSVSTSNSSWLRLMPYWPADTTGRSVTGRPSEAHSGTGIAWLYARWV